MSLYINRYKGDKFEFLTFHYLFCLVFQLRRSHKNETSKNGRCYSFLHTTNKVQSHDIQQHFHCDKEKVNLSFRSIKIRGFFSKKTRKNCCLKLTSPDTRRPWFYNHNFLSNNLLQQAELHYKLNIPEFRISFESKFETTREIDEEIFTHREASPSSRVQHSYQRVEAPSFLSYKVIFHNKHIPALQLLLIETPGVVFEAFWERYIKKNTNKPTSFSAMAARSDLLETKIHIPLYPCLLLAIA